MLVKYVCDDCYPEDSPYKCELWTQYNERLSVSTCPVDGIEFADWKLTKKYRKILHKKEDKL